MSTILSIETSTEVCSVAVHRDGQLLGFSESRRQKSHSSLVVAMIDQLLSNANVEKTELSAIAVSKGPGSYTGLRIGTSTAKGLCYALGIPLIAIDTLESMALEASMHVVGETYIIPMLDARRAEVYCEVFNQDMEMIEEPKPVILDNESFGHFEKRSKLVVIGNGAAKAAELMGERTGAIFWDHITPSAKHIGELALKSFDQKHWEDLTYFEPFYLKEFYTPKPPKSLA